MNSELDKLYANCGELENLMNKTKEMTYKLKKASGKILDGMQDLTKLLKKHINYCSICMNNPRRVVCNPCGHTQCITCTTELSKEMKCFTCRAEVVSTFKIYM